MLVFFDRHTMGVTRSSTVADRQPLEVIERIRHVDSIRAVPRVRPTHRGDDERTSGQIPVDAYRRGNEFKVLFDLPGVDSRFIDLTVEKDLLTVKATRGWVHAEGDQVQIAERAQGEFSRQLFLGESLDRDHLPATYENGVLAYHIPVAEEAKPRKVEITHAGDLVECAAGSAAE